MKFLIKLSFLGFLSLCGISEIKAQASKIVLEYTASGHRKVRKVVKAAGKPAVSQVDSSLLAGISLYPSPTADITQLTLPRNSITHSSMYELTIYDGNGRMLRKEQLPDGVHTLDLQSYADGRYMVIIRQGDLVKVEQIVKSDRYH